MKAYEPFDNYLAEMRKRAGLSQEEVGTLLDEDRNKIRRYEQQAVVPTLARAIALELLFDEPMQRVFAGLAVRIRAQIAARARVLLQHLSDKTTEENAQKLATLARLGRIDREDFTPWKDAA